LTLHEPVCFRLDCALFELTIGNQLFLVRNLGLYVVLVKIMAHLGSLDVVLSRAFESLSKRLISKQVDVENASLGLHLDIDQNRHE